MFDLFFPTYCINCGRVGNYLCPWCIKKLKNTLPECYVCRKISNKYITHDECNKDGLDRVFVGWEYSNISKKILAQYKYRCAYKISEILSSILIQRLEITGFSKNITPNTLLIPIPIHSSHEKKRGFNQSLLLATHLSKYFECRMNPNIIKRVGDHKYQSQQSVQNRLSMGKNTFEVIGNLEVLGEDIMLIDDVMSTGTTLNRACSALRGNKISAITLFRGKPHYQYLRE